MMYSSIVDWKAIVIISYELFKYITLLFYLPLDIWFDYTFMFMDRMQPVPLK